jgi:hypothetical protein
MLRLADLEQSKNAPGSKDPIRAVETGRTCRCRRREATDRRDHCPPRPPCHPEEAESHVKRATPDEGPALSLAEGAPTDLAGAV